MTRATIVLTMALLGAVCVAAQSLAGGATGTIMTVEGDKVVVQLPSGKGAGFPVGMRDVEVRQSGDVSVRGRIVASGKDRITVKVVRGKASTLRAGAIVVVGQAADAGAEGIDGC